MKLNIKDIDQEFQDEFKKDFEYWNGWTNDKTLLLGILENGKTKAKCLHKFKHCENKCKKAKENVFYCEFCGED
jgi:hypothetical protein